MKNTEKLIENENKIFLEIKIEKLLLNFNIGKICLN